MDQNTRATHADTHQGLLDHLRGTQEIIVTRPDVLELVTRGEQEPDTMTELERVRFYEFIAMRYAVWEVAYVSLQNGLMDRDHYAGYEGYFVGSVNKPGYKAYWQDNSEWFIEPFKSYAASKFENQPTADEAG